MGRIIITADLGHFKAYRIVKDPDGQESTRLELIEAHDIIEAHMKDADMMSDSPGAFRRSAWSAQGAGATMGSGTGERHSIPAEREKRIVRRAAETICQILTREGLPKWHLCAAKAINNFLVESLSPDVRAKLGMNIKADLTKADKGELLARFET